jgi:hypothetical protein
MLEGEQFVRAAAYLRLLVDSESLASYVRRLRSDRDKRELIADAVLSKEGHWIAQDVSGLSLSLDNCGTCKQPLSAHFIKRLAVDPVSPIQAQLRALENRLDRFDGHNAELQAQRGAVLAELHRTIRIHSRSLEAYYSDVQKLAGVLHDGGFRKSIPQRTHRLTSRRLPNARAAFFVAVASRFRNLKFRFNVDCYQSAGGKFRPRCAVAAWSWVGARICILLVSTLTIRVM